MKFEYKSATEIEAMSDAEKQTYLEEKRAHGDSIVSSE